MHRGLAPTVALASLLAVAGLAAGQSSSGAGTGYLSPEPAPNAQVPSSPDCGEPKLHGIGPAIVSPGQVEKAYTGTSTPTAACPTYVRGAVDQPFNLTGEPSLTLFVGCEQPTTFGTGFPNIQVTMTRSNEPIASGSGSVGPSCQSGDVLEAQIDLTWENDSFSGGVFFSTSDRVGLNMSVFGGPNTGNNIHLLTGTNDTGSKLTAPGLYQPVATDPENPFDDEVRNETNDTNTSQQSGDASSGDSSPIPGFGAAAAVAVGLAVAACRGRD